MGKPQHLNCHPQVAQTHNDQHPPGDDAGDAESQNRAENQQAIGYRVKNLPDFADLVEFARDDAIESVRSGGDGDKRQRRNHLMPRDQRGDEWNRDDSQRADQIRHSEIQVTRLWTVSAAEFVVCHIDK